MKLIRTAAFSCTFLLACGAFAQAGRMPQGGMQSPNQPGMAQPGQQPGMEPTTGQSQDPSAQPSEQAPSDAQQPSAQPQQSAAGAPSIDEQVQHLSQQLNLNADQQSKVKSALEDQHNKAMDVVQDNTLAREDKISKIHALRENTIAKIRTTLNDDQQKKFDLMVQQMKQREQASPQSQK